MANTLGSLILEIIGDDSKLRKTLGETKGQVAKYDKEIQALQKKGLSKRQAELQVSLKRQQTALKKAALDEIALLRLRSVSGIISERKFGRDRLRIIKQTADQIKAVQSGASGLSGTVGGLSGTLGKGLAAGVAFAATRRLTGSLVDAAKAADKANNRLSALDAIVRANNGSIVEARKVVDDLTADGLIPKDAIAEALKNLTAFGFSVKESNQFLKANIDLGVKNRESHYSLGEAVVQVSRGLKNNNSILTDSTGISENLSVILKKAGLSQTALNDEVTAGSARQAILNKFLFDGAKFTGDAARATDQFSGQLLKLSSSSQKAEVAIGEAAGSAFAPFVELLTSAADSFTGWFSGLSKTTQQILIFIPLITGLGVAIGLLSPILVAFGASLTFALGPIGWVILAMAALAVGIAVVVGEGETELEQNEERIEQYLRLKKTREDLNKQGKDTAKIDAELLRLAELMPDRIRKVADENDDLNASLDTRRGIVADILELEDKLNDPKNKTPEGLKTLLDEAKAAQRDALDDFSAAAAFTANKDTGSQRSRVLSSTGATGLRGAAERAALGAQASTNAQAAIKATTALVQKLNGEISKLNKVEKKTVVLSGFQGSRGKAKKLLSDNLFLLSSWEKTLVAINKQHAAQIKFLEQERDRVGGITAEVFKQKEAQADNIKSQQELNVELSRTVTAAEGFRDTLSAIKTKSIGGVLQGIGKVGSAIKDKWIQEISRSIGLIGSLVSIFSAIGSLIGDNTNELAEQQKELERLSSEYEEQIELQETLADLQRERIGLLKEQLDLENKIADTFSATSIEATKDQIQNEKQFDRKLLRQEEDNIFSILSGSVKRKNINSDILSTDSITSEAGQNVLSGALGAAKKDRTRFKTIRARIAGTVDLINKTVRSKSFLSDSKIGEISSDIDFYTKVLQDPTFPPPIKQAISGIIAELNSLSLAGFTATGDKVGFKLGQILSGDVKRNDFQEGIIRVDSGTAIGGRLADQGILAETGFQNANSGIAALSDLIDSGQNLVDLRDNLAQLRDQRDTEGIQDVSADAARLFEETGNKKFIKNAIKEVRKETGFKGDLGIDLVRALNKAEGAEFDQLSVLQTLADTLQSIDKSNDTIADQTEDTSTAVAELVALSALDANIVDIASGRLRSLGGAVPIGGLASIAAETGLVAEKVATDSQAFNSELSALNSIDFKIGLAVELLGLLTDLNAGDDLSTEQAAEDILARLDERRVG